MNRRRFLQATAASAATLAFSRNSFAADNPDLAIIQKEIEKRHDESVQRLQHWIRQPSIAAEHRGMDEGCDLAMHMLRDAGFGQVTKIPTDGQPGIFATLDAGAPRTLGIYFMYDVKQVDPAEWSSPPFEAAIIEKPGVGKAVIGRGAVNQKGPGGFLPGGAARDSRLRPQTSRESCVRGGRRRRNRLAAFSADRTSSRSAGCAAQMLRCLHTLGRAGPRRKSHDDARR